MMNSRYTTIANLQNFPVLRNDNILKVAWGKMPSRLPIWIMRQAGRYLPEFLEFRERHSFFEICQTPELVCQATLMPLRRYDLDAAIIFSDILVIPQALGMYVEMKHGVGPVFLSPLTLETMEELNTNGAVDRLLYVGKAITLTRTKLDGKVPLIGFTGAPWTLMCYMIEGGGSKTCSQAKKWLYANPEEAHKLLSLLTDVIIEYLVMQVEYGAQLLKIFDSCAEFLNNSLYTTFCVPYLKKITAAVPLRIKKFGVDSIPMIIFAKGAYHNLQELHDCGFQVIAVDWTMDPKKVKKDLLGRNVSFQGNLDPCALYAPKKDLENIIKEMLEGFGKDKYIVNLGHGIYPDTSPEAIQTFVDVVHKF